MLWLALVVAIAALVWWWRTHARRVCRDCGGRAVFCAIPFVCPARRRGIGRR